MESDDTKKQAPVCCKAEGQKGIVLSDTDIWFRDMLYKLLGWGAGVLVVITGWVMSYELDPPNGLDKLNLCNDGGEAFLWLSILSASTWIGVVLSCYSHLWRIGNPRR